MIFSMKIIVFIDNFTYSRHYNLKYRIIFCNLYFDFDFLFPLVCDFSHLNFKFVLTKCLFHFFHLMFCNKHLQRPPPQKKRKKEEENAKGHHL